ncbi:MAG: hypothetical protein ABI724_08885 [Betaproteobacteria bacterium]
MPTPFASGEAVADTLLAMRRGAVAVVREKVTRCYHCGNASPDPDRWNGELQDEAGDA